MSHMMYIYLILRAQKRGAGTSNVKSVYLPLMWSVMMLEKYGDLDDHNENGKCGATLLY